MLAMGRSDWLYRWALAYCLVGAAVMLVSAQWGLVGVSLGLAAVVAVLTPFEMKMALGLVEMRLATYLRSLLPHLVTRCHGRRGVARGAGADRSGGRPSLQLLVGVVVGAVVYAVVDVASSTPGGGRRASGAPVAGRSRRP